MNAASWVSEAMYPVAVSPLDTAVRAAGSFPASAPAMRAAFRVALNTENSFSACSVVRREEQLVLPCKKVPVCSCGPGDNV